MVQPKRKGVNETVNKKKKAKKILDERIPPNKNVKTRKKWYKKEHAEYGTSKLEERFARDFLDKIGVKYVYQYKAVSIGRYFDFRICVNEKPIGPIIEIQGSYWHGDPRLYEENELNRTQKRDKKIDEYKKAWCDRNGIPLIYIWELDINKQPEKVLQSLKVVLEPFINGEIENKSRRH